MYYRKLQANEWNPSSFMLRKKTLIGVVELFDLALDWTVVYLVYLSYLQIINLNEFTTSFISVSCD